jgi:hypothetical protein
MMKRKRTFFYNSTYLKEKKPDCWNKNWEKTKITIRKHILTPMIMLVVTIALVLVLINFSSSSIKSSDGFHQGGGQDSDSQVGCPSGQTIDPATGECLGYQGGCPSGQTIDPATGECVTSPSRRGSIEDSRGDGFSPYGQNVTSSVNFIPYQDPINGIRMMVPANWEKQVYNQGESNEVYWISSEADAASFGLSIQPTNKDLMAYSKAKIDAMIGYGNITIKTEQPTFIGETKPAYSVTFRENQATSDTVQVLTVEKGKAYVLTFFSDPSTYDKNVYAFRQMVDSFQTSSR